MSFTNSIIEKSKDGPNKIYKNNLIDPHIEIKDFLKEFYVPSNYFKWNVDAYKKYSHNYQISELEYLINQGHFCDIQRYSVIEYMQTWMNFDDCQLRYKIVVTNFKGWSYATFWVNFTKNGLELVHERPDSFIEFRESAIDKIYQVHSFIENLKSMNDPNYIRKISTILMKTGNKCSGHHSVYYIDKDEIKQYHIVSSYGKPDEYELMNTFTHDEIASLEDFESDALKRKDS